MGKNMAIEKVQIRIKGMGSFCANPHIRNVGWQGSVCRNSGQVVEVGTEGQALPMEALQVYVDNPGVRGRAHVQNYGWLPDQYASSVMELGTTGQVRNLESIEMWIV
ncbi:hypothetical protein BGK72_39110 [Streptomyces agglomeratus]|nr:hypothetical protein BGK72_39110 [Streptomyces agglomeratus]